MKHTPHRIDAISPLLYALCLAFVLTGCIEDQLKKNTIAQIDRVTEINESVVLDNIAMSEELHGYALPWQVVLAQGTVTMNDSIATSLNYSEKAPMAGMGTQLSGAVGVAPSRAWQGQWQVNVVNDAKVLRNLQAYYRRLVNSSVKWYKTGKAPPQIGCPMGHYGLTSVWVEPEHLNELAKATSDVLRITGGFVPKLFTLADINVPALAEKLKTPNDLMSSNLRSMFTPELRILIDTDGRSALFANQLVSAINGIVENNSLVDVVRQDNRVSGGHWSQLIEDVMVESNAQKLPGASMVKLNEDLLLDAYRGIIRQPTGAESSHASEMNMQRFAYPAGAGYSIQ